MKLKKRYVLLLILVSFLTCCKWDVRKSQKTSHEVYNTIHGFEKKESVLLNKNCTEITIKDFPQHKQALRFSSVFDSIKYIKLKTNKQSLIAKIDKIEILDSCIYILDRRISKSVFIFDLDGNFIKKIKRVGKGPGEYLLLQNFFFEHSKNLLTLFVNNNKFIYFDTLGNYIGEKKLPFFAGQAAWLENNTYAFDLHFKKPPFNLLCVDIEANKFSQFFPYDIKKISDIGILPIDFHHSYSQLLYKPALNKSIYEIRNHCLDKQYSFNSSRDFKVFDFFDTSKYLFFSLALEEEQYLTKYVYDKNTKLVIEEYIFFDDINSLPYSGIICGSDENRIILQIEPTTLKEITKKSNFTLPPLMKDINPNDNPILCVAQIK